MTFPSLQPGDWICFRQLGLPTYARIEYVCQTATGRTEFVTTGGTCGAEEVLEVRRQREAELTAQREAQP